MLQGHLRHSVGRKAQVFHGKTACHVSLKPWRDKTRMNDTFKTSREQIFNTYFSFDIILQDQTRDTPLKTLKTFPLASFLFFSFLFVSFLFSYSNCTYLWETFRHLTHVCMMQCLTRDQHVYSIKHLFCMTKEKKWSSFGIRYSLLTSKGILPWSALPS